MSAFIARRAVTLTTANILDADSIKESVATSTSAVSYTGVALDGVDANPGPAYPTPDAQTGVPQYPMAVGAGAGAFAVGSTVSWVGTYGGKATTRTATVTSADGGTLIADGPLDSVTTVDVDAQADTDGTWTFGFTDIGAWKLNGMIDPVKRIRAEAAGVVAIQDDDGNTDLTPFQAYESQDILARRIVQATTTATSFTIYR